MRAIVLHGYGSADGLRLDEVAAPAIDDDSFLVRVRASSMNRADAYSVRGTPWLLRALMMRGKRPDPDIQGTDVAGVVEAVGKNVTAFRPGDEVFGARSGAYAEYVRATEKSALVRKPANVTFEQAGSVGVAACTALQGLRDVGQLRAGQRVLINGATGGVGTFAVQIAKALGAHVTAVCGPRNVDLIRSIGADEVIDYSKEDFTKRPARYDLIFDVVSTRSLAATSRLLVPGGTLVIVGFRKITVPGLVGRLLGARIWSRLTGHPMRFFIAKLPKADFAVLAEMMESGKLTPVVDRTYPLARTPEALDYLLDGHARGKVVISV